MKKKDERLDAIKRLIASQEITGQEMLLSLLVRDGFELTQATLSRDLKQLKVAKASNGSGKYVYVLPNNVLYKRASTEITHHDTLIRQDGFLSLEFSGNLAVIKTRPGYASSLAYDIDARLFEEIIGTIAGDDTLILVLREGYTRADLKNSLSVLIPSL